MTSGTGILLGIGLGIILTSLAGLVLLTGRYRLVPKTLKFPFLEFGAERFADLSPIRIFASLSRRIIAPSPHAREWLVSNANELEPVILVHVGWQVVCDSFVERFAAYPDEKNVRARANDLGVQNADFIIIYGLAHAAAAREGDSVDMEFAREYFLRAPSLAQRISRDGRFERNKLFELLAATIAGFDA